MIKLMYSFLALCTFVISFLSATMVYDTFDRSFHIYDEGIADSRSWNE